MPTNDSCSGPCSSSRNILISGIFCIIIGLTLMGYLKEWHISISTGEPISDFLLKALGILSVLIGSMCSVVICMHYLMSNENPSETVLTDNNRINQNQMPDRSILDAYRIQSSATHPSIEIYPLRDFSSVSVPKPAESDLPPSYEEVMASIHTSGLSK